MLSLFRSHSRDSHSSRHKCYFVCDKVHKLFARADLIAALENRVPEWSSQQRARAGSAHTLHKMPIAQLRAPYIGRESEDMASRLLGDRAACSLGGDDRMQPGGAACGRMDGRSQSASKWAQQSLEYVGCSGDKCV